MQPYVLIPHSSQSDHAQYTCPSADPKPGNSYADNAALDQQLIIEAGIAHPGFALASRSTNSRLSPL